MNQILLDRIKALLVQNDELMKRVITLRIENASLREVKEEQ